MSGRIVEKFARHNLCFADFEPDYKHGKEESLRSKMFRCFQKFALLLGRYSVILGKNFQLKEIITS
jgi:hypothetical protein